MPKGKHKGARRQFTDFEAESRRKEMEEKEATWRARRGELPSDDEEGKKSSPASESEESEESSSEEESEGEAKVPKAKGVSGLIQLENPNRQAVKTSRKVTDLEPAADGAETTATTTAPAAGKPQLSRREREELEKQRATAHYRKLHAAGKTDEARADLERLAIIKQKRVEAEEKRKEQQQAKEAASTTKKDGVKTGGKKKS